MPLVTPASIPSVTYAAMPIAAAACMPSVIPTSTPSAVTNQISQRLNSVAFFYIHQQFYSGHLLLAASHCCIGMPH